MRTLDLIELFPDGLAKGHIVDVSKDEYGFEDPSKGLQSTVELVLLGVELSLRNKADAVVSFSLIVATNLRISSQCFLCTAI